MPKSLKYLAILLALVAPQRGFAQADSVGPDGYRLSEPVSHGNLAIYFIYGASRGGPVPLTLEEALQRKTIVVRETGQVNELSIENTGDQDIFIQAGDIVKGGQQDRVLSVSRILPSHSGAIPISSFCVEAGRWSARGGEDVRTFAELERSIAVAGGAVADRRKRRCEQRRRSQRSAGDLAQRRGDPNQTVQQSRRASRGAAIKHQPATVARKRATSVRAACVYRRTGAKGYGQRRHRRLCLCHQWQDQQRRYLSLKRPLQEDVAEIAAPKRDRGDRRTRPCRRPAARRPRRPRNSSPKRKLRRRSKRIPVKRRAPLCARVRRQWPSKRGHRCRRRRVDPSQRARQMNPAITTGCSGHPTPEPTHPAEVRVGTAREASLTVARSVSGAHLLKNIRQKRQETDDDIPWQAPKCPAQHERTDTRSTIDAQGVGIGGHTPNMKQQRARPEHQIKQSDKQPTPKVECRSHGSHDFPSPAHQLQSIQNGGP